VVKVGIGVALTVIVPPRSTGEHEPAPDEVTVYAKEPLAEGVPAITNVEPTTEPLIPAGNAPAVMLADVAPPPNV
jgi:hypothetical protein